MRVRVDETCARNQLLAARTMTSKIPTIRLYYLMTNAQDAFGIQERKQSGIRE